VPKTSPGVTVAIGAVLSVGALIGSTVIIVAAQPSSAVRIVVVAVALVVAIVGGVLMLKDLTP
jgi:hypothetical protein